MTQEGASPQVASKRVIFIGLFDISRKCCICSRRTYTPVSCMKNSMNLQTYPELMTVEEVAEYLRTSTRTILNWASRGEIPAGKIGSEWRFRRDDVRVWVESRFRTEESDDSAIRLKDVLEVERIFILDEDRKTDVLDRLITVLADSPRITNPDAAKRAIFGREALMSTGIGLQIAVPHARIPEVTDLTVGVAVTRTDVTDYDSIDSLPVRIVIMILAREDQHKDHLRLVSLFSNRLKRSALRKSILAATRPSEIYDLLVND